MKKSTLFTIGLILFTFFLSAQSIERQLIGVAGENDSGNQIMLDWTLGETFTAYDNTLLGDYKEGFLQPVNLLKEISEDNLKDNIAFAGDATAETFPNPFSNSFTFQVNKAYDSDNQFIILDYSGKILSKNTFPSGSLKMESNMNGYPPGLYFLQIVDDAGNLQHSFKLLKL